MAEPRVRPIPLLGKAGQWGSSMSQIYFAYGSNMWLQQMQSRCPHSPLLGVGLLPGYRWIITTRGYANIVVDYEHQVEGLVFWLSPEDERLLDLYEGVEQEKYHKVVVQIFFQGAEQPALTYVDPVISEGKPREEYVGRINAALLDAPLSTEYIKRVIRPFVPAPL